jgi:endoglucanase
LSLFGGFAVTLGLLLSPSTPGFEANAHSSRTAISTLPAIHARGVASPVGASTIVQGAAAAQVGGIGTTAAKIGSSTAPGHSTGTSKPNWVNSALYVDPTNEATQYAVANPSAPGASYITRMGQMPVAEWFGDWNTNISSDVNSYVSSAAAAHAVPVLALYNIPNRDCGGYSTGGAGSVTAYTQWTQSVANAIGNRTAVIILEPDAMGAVDCLPTASEQQQRYQAVSQAVSILKAHSQTSVYIDAGTPVWQPAATMASRLQKANIAAADGFSLNVSYFASIGMNQTYGNQLSALVGNKHYVIDTSRNGASMKVGGAMCNPRDAAFGHTPSTATGSSLTDGYLWIKIPWESDGQCNGDPNPGIPFWSYAILLAQNAGW